MKNKKTVIFMIITVIVIVAALFLIYKLPVKDDEYYTTNRFGMGKNELQNKVYEFLKTQKGEVITATE